MSTMMLSDSAKELNSSTSEQLHRSFEHQDILDILKTGKITCRHALRVIDMGIVTPQTDRREDPESERKITAEAHEVCSVTITFAAEWNAEKLLKKITPTNYSSLEGTAIFCYVEKDGIRYYSKDRELSNNGRIILDGNDVLTFSYVRKSIPKDATYKPVSEQDYISMAQQKRRAAVKQ